MAFAAQGLPRSPLPISSSSRPNRRRPSTTTTSLSAPLQPNLPSSSSSSPQNPPPKSKSLLPSSQTLVLSATATAATATLLCGGGGGGFFGGGGSGGGGGGGFWSRFFSAPMAVAKDDEEPGRDWDSHGLPGNIVVQLAKLSGLKKYRVSEVLFFDRRRRSTTSATAGDTFFEMVSLQPGGTYRKADLLRELESLATCGMFEKVDMEAKTKPDGTLGVTISFVEATWQSADSFRCINVGLMQQTKPAEADPDMTEKEKMEYFRGQEREYRRRIERSRPCLLPIPVNREIVRMLREQGAVSARLLQRIRDRVQKWYHDEGYLCAMVVNFGNLNTREVVCEVVEGDITQLSIQFQDKLGNVCEGNTQLGLVRRELPKQKVLLCCSDEDPGEILRQGHVFNMEAGKLALKNLNSLGLFSNIEVNPRQDEKNEGGIILEVKLKEVEPKSTEASIQPGGTVSFEHRNIYGLNRSINGTVSSNNLLNPQDDLSFKLEYVHPYLDGLYNPRNRTGRVSCFNNRKLSPVFVGGPGVDDVPAIWVDRVGLKATIAEAYTRQSKFTYGIVAEEITTRDETSSICTNGSRALPTGGLSMDGPPTTLSGTGIDRVAFLQANITRDNTKFINGATVGERNIFQVDQGLFAGSKYPFFNRHQLSVTRFIPLKTVEEGADKPPPPVLILHGRYGGCVGDLPSYDAFTLGGPYSVRGYNMGELGACRNILELAGELRVPVKGTQVYVFAEHGNDLGSSKNVKGNPTEFFRRAGQGSSYGAGIKVGMARFEYACDHNAGTGAWFCRFGDRF
ncbi:hypothetical protein QJS10_CPB14g01617 [Acorus calamus]|uniref:Bacterial surface antigen (D15) domain-containing protein n=1 Tax=Acorus calamus TaxID=4465 RepID=A0AAV9DCN1_ACOCL|nr:hypothetical protein QJS10_CPB14g01617 [Acorus calamus]